MNQKQIKLKWKIFGFIFVFAVIIVLVFAFFQIGMLESFYKNTKTNAIESLTVDVASKVETYDYNELKNNNVNLDDLYSLSSNNETAIYIFNSDGTQVSIINNGMYLNEFLKADVFTDIYNKAKKTGLSVFFIAFDGKNPSNIGSYPIVNKKVIDSIDNAIICGSFVKMSNGTEVFVILDARLTPVAPAVETLKKQLLYISVIVLVLTIAMALFISYWISKPINEMTETAKLLANGRRDITFKGRGFEEIHTLNDTLNYAVEELNKTDDLQKELLANISHDLKTPLTLIAGYAEMMKDMPEEVNEENLTIITDEVNRLNLLVNDLLNLSKLQAHTVVFNFDKINITKLIKDIVSRNEKLLEQEGYTFNFIYNEEVYIKADEAKISQVLYNFLINAVNYSIDNKNIDIIQEASEDEVKITIKDYGVGIKKEDLDVIWNRYYRVDKGHKRSVQGSGLGLSIVSEILKAHNFNYGVDSVYNEGSSFYFIAPLLKNDIKKDE